MSTQSRDPTLKCMRLVPLCGNFRNFLVQVHISRNDPNCASYTLDTLEAGLRHINELRLNILTLFIC